MDLSLFPGIKDICLLIFKYLKITDLFALQCTNKKFRLLIQESNIWNYHANQIIDFYVKLLSDKDDKSFECFEHCLNPLSRFKQLISRIQIKCCHYLNSMDLWLISQNMQYAQIIGVFGNHYSIFHDFFEKIKKNQYYIDFL